MKKKVFLIVAAVLMVTGSFLAAQTTYEDIFLEIWDELHDSSNGYFSPEGAPYHSIETVMVEAPDHGHESTSEAYSFYIWLEAMYGKVTGDWSYLETAWQRTEEHLIPDEALNNYNTSSPATYASEYPTPDQYPSTLEFDYPVGRDPVWSSLSGAYGNIPYGMHWIVDCDDFYEYAASNDGKKPVFINTFQRGPQESTWETIPHPSYETFDWGGSNGFLDLFVDDQSYSRQWRFTNAPDADARVVQAMYWAREGGYNGSRIADAAEMGDWLRLSMFDKYFKQISENTTPQSSGNGYDSCHYLLSWYYAWGGGMNNDWSWIIGCSHVHMGYQNIMCAYALSEDPDFRPPASNAVTDWSTSLDRMLDFYEWLQAPRGPIAGGATNSWQGSYSTYPSANGTFNGMCYDPNPVYQDPGSNTWPGFQAWSVERLAEYYYVTGNSRAGAILDTWVDWLISDITYSATDFQIPARFTWSGSPGDWNGSSSNNSGLNVVTEDYGRDLGVAACFAKALCYYAAAANDSEAQAAAKGLIDAIYSFRDDQGVCTPEDRGDYERFYNQEVYVPSGWSGSMGNGDAIRPGVTFIEIRSNYLNDPAFQAIQSTLQSGGTPTMRYHRFWAQVDFALACLVYNDLFGDDPLPTDAPTTPPDQTTAPTAPPTGDCNVSLNPSNSTQGIGSTFDIAVVVDTGSQEIAAYGIDINYDSRYINAIDADEGADGFLSAFNLNNPGVVALSGFDTNGAGPGSAVELVVITFEAVSEGSSILEIVVDELVDGGTVRVGDACGNNGSVTVSDVTLGDVNGDGNISILDALLVAQYYVQLDPSPFNPAAADTNCDGSITITDALLIARYYVDLESGFCL